MNVDWQALFFEQDWLSKLDRLASIRFGDSALASEAANYAFQKLSNDEWSCLSEFKGDSKPETYLRAVGVNYLEEFSRKKFGRPRPPKWLTERGPLWVTAWKMICIERQLEGTVIKKLNHQYQREKEIIVNAIRTIRGKLPWCGHKTQEIPESVLSFDGEDEAMPYMETVSDGDPGHAAHAEGALLAESLLVISAFLNQQLDNTQLLELTEKHLLDTQQLAQSITGFHECLDLSDDEVIVLKMIYQDGFKRKEIARVLKVPDYQPGRIAKSAITKIKAALKQAGVDIDEVETLVKELL